jgi:hypothetical protein
LEDGTGVFHDSVGFARKALRRNKCPEERNAKYQQGSKVVRIHVGERRNDF